MNLKYLNLDKYGLDKYGIPEDAEIQIAVYLIAADLKARKLTTGLSNIGCDNPFCVPDLCELALSFAGFAVHNDELYKYYFDLLDRYCEKITEENCIPIKEAFLIYKTLNGQQQKFKNLPL